MINLAVLFLQYDTEKYNKAFGDLIRYLSKVDCNKKIIIIDNKIESEYVKHFDGLTLINGDNTEWEFSGWDRGVKYLNDNKIPYDAVLFVNDSFMNDGSGGTPETIIDSQKILKCVQKNVPIQAVVNVGRPDYFKLNGVNTDIRGRSHCFILSKPIIDKLQKITSFNVDFIDKCINKEVSKPYFKADAPINDNLRYFVEGWLGGYWHSAFKFEDNWNLFRMKTLAFFNELMLASRIKDLETDYKFQIDNADVVVFDVFDTAIFRKFNHPSDVHYHMGQSFLGDRQEAEKKALTRNFNSNINDIYNIGNLPFNKFLQEIELENAVCYQNEEIYKFYQYAKDSSKKVVFLSDMYLSSVDIKKMLEKCGYENPEIYVSNEINLRKDSGQAYLLLKSVYPDKKMLMIGDNKHSDYKMAKKSGLKAIHYKKSENEQDFWYKLGYNSIGAIAYAYVAWLKEQFKEKGIQKVYFFAREGDLFSKIYNEIKTESDPEGVLLHLSRKVLNSSLIAGISQEEFFENPEHQHIKWHLTFTLTATSTQNYCEYFGIDYATVFNKLYAAELVYYDLAALSFKQREEIQTEILKVIYPEVREKAKESLLSIKRYFHEKIDFTSEKIAVVDLGWGGSIQESFIKFIKKHSWSYLYKTCECFLLAPEERLKDRLDKYSFNTFLELNNSTFIKNVYLVECLFNAPYGSTLGYTENQEPIFDDEDCGYCEFIHRGVIDFVKDSKFMTIGSYKKLGLFQLNRLAQSPTEDEAKYIGNLKLYSAGTNGFYEYIAKPDLSFVEEQKQKARNKQMFALRLRQEFANFGL